MRARTASNEAKKSSALPLSTRYSNVPNALSVISTTTGPPSSAFATSDIAIDPASKLRRIVSNFFPAFLSTFGIWSAAVTGWPLYKRAPSATSNRGPNKRRVCGLLLSLSAVCGNAIKAASRCACLCSPYLVTCV
ncbi:hypothetical protein BCR44DRAFT_1433224 [Catenaria anguillulae PL171]|uniref:Uncharacterized protein n=1 Tax=Catenaria anguillulae PL171 TaxID=765915 RepID=A0A1Y2HN21_9FUNG|nr:hypothetical protein BCR44DRAFT_1433224 [Catenaria anguillulae PL171]